MTALAQDNSEKVIDTGEEDLEVDGGGGACIVTTGNCNLDINAGSVSH